MSSYHHGNLRAALIEQGVELARAEGAAGVVLREVARRAGVSHNAAYRHFADREALLGEVARAGMRRLRQAMQEHLDAVDREGIEDAADRASARLRAVGQAYVGFALAEPGLFDVAFSAVPEGGEPDPDGDPYGLLTQVLDEALDAGVVAPERRPGAEVICWAAVHGFATLHLRGPVAATPDPERDATLEVMLDHVARGLA